MVEWHAREARPRPWHCACGGPDRSGCGAWPRPRRQRNGRGCPSAWRSRHRPAAGTPREPGRSPGASDRAFPGPICASPACVILRRPGATTARRRGGRLVRHRTGCGSRHSWASPNGSKLPAAEKHSRSLPATRPQCLNIFGTPLSSLPFPRAVPTIYGVSIPACRFRSHDHAQVAAALLDSPCPVRHDLRRGYQGGQSPHHHRRRGIGPQVEGDGAPS